jgi:DNA-binding LytR/AlgR family response regulator
VGEVECAFDGRDALAKLSSQRYDAIFLDVRMPDLDGLELARVMRRFAAPPQLVFVSAYDGAAVEAFELRALDYLRKPVARRRVEEAVERVVAAIDAAPPTSERPRERSQPSEDEMIAVANLHGGTTRLLPRSSIEYVQAYGDFVRIVTADGRYLLRATLSDIERRWEQYGFVRVHRQYVANLRVATELRPLIGGGAELTFKDGQTVPVARRHTAHLVRRLSV